MTTLYGIGPCVMNDGTPVVSPFNGPNGVWFGDKFIAAPIWLWNLFGDYLPSGAFCVIGGGQNGRCYVVAQDGRVADLGPFGYNSQTCRNIGGTFYVAFYDSTATYRFGTLDPATFAVTSEQRPAPTTISAGILGIHDDLTIEWAGNQPATLGGIQCNRQITSSCMTVAQAQAGGICQWNGLTAGIILPNTVTFEPNISPNGQFYVARGNAPTMYAGPLAGIPPVVVPPDYPPLDLDPSEHVYYLAPTLEVTVDTWTDLPLVSTDAGTNSATFTSGYLWSMRPGQRDKFAFADYKQALPTIPPKWLKAVVGSIESAGQYEHVPIGAPIDLEVRALKDAAIKANVACVLNIDAIHVSKNPWVLKRWFAPEAGLSLYCEIELYPDKLIGLNAAATYNAWIDDAMAIEAFNPDLPIAVATTAYTQSGAWPVEFVRELQPFAKQFVNLFTVKIVQPFAISRTSGVISSPEALWPVITAWDDTNGDGPLPDLLYAVPPQPQPEPETMMLSNEIRAAQVAQKSLANAHGSSAVAGDWSDQVIFHTSNDLMAQRGLTPPATDPQNLKLMALMADGMDAQAAGDAVFGPPKT